MAAWPSWAALASNAVHPTDAACNHSAGLLPRRTCISSDLKLVYELNSKAGSSLVRGNLRDRYGLQGVSTQCERPEALHSKNLTSRGFAWFTLVRDPVERFLSAVAEVSLRNMPHPPLYRNGTSWAVNHSAVRLCKHARGDGLAGKYGPKACTHYPASASERLDMVLFLVTRAHWNDVHFLPQWDLIRSAAVHAPKLVERGFVGSVCDAVPLFELWRKSESEEFRNQSDEKAYVGHPNPLNSKRQSQCPSKKGFCSNVLMVPEPHPWQAARIREHYAQDYACLGHVLRRCSPPKPNDVRHITRLSDNSSWWNSPLGRAVGG